MTAIDTFKTQQKPKWEDGKRANGANFSQFIDAIATAIQETVNESAGAGDGVSLEDVKTAINNDTINIKPIIDATVTAGVKADTYKIKSLIQQGITDGTITIPNAGTGTQNIKFGRHSIDKFNRYVSYSGDNMITLYGFDYFDDTTNDLTTPRSLDCQILSGTEYLQPTNDEYYRFLMIKDNKNGRVAGYIFRPDGAILFLQQADSGSGYKLTPVPAIVG